MRKLTVVSSFVYNGMQLSNIVRAVQSTLDNTGLIILTDQDVISHQYGVTGKVLSLNSDILSLCIELCMSNLLSMESDT